MGGRRGRQVRGGDGRNPAAPRGAARARAEERHGRRRARGAARGVARRCECRATGRAWPQTRGGRDRVKSQSPNPKSQADPGPAPPSQFDDLDSHKYVGFEDQFRGSPEDIRRRVEEYLPIFSGITDQGSGIGGDVLDIGCGRGEFLDLLREHGIRARGVDVNPAMVEVCRGKGLEAETADALAYLRGLPDASLGGLFAAQVVEHLEPRYLARLLDAAFEKLRPGAPIVLETINPACWFAFFESYIRDLTHVRPVHPDTLKYLLIATGFQHVEIRYRAP